MSLIEGHVFVYVVLGCLKFDPHFISLEQLYRCELILIAEATFGSELQDFFDYLLIYAIIMLIIDVPSYSNVKHRVTFLVLCIDISF